MPIVHQYNKANDTTYVYDVQSYYVPSIHQSRKKKRLIGKIDPTTGEVVPTGPRGRPRKNSAEPTGRKDTKDKPEGSELEAAKKRLAECAQKIDQLDGTVSDLKSENAILRNKVNDLTTKIGKIQQIIIGEN